MERMRIGSLFDGSGTAPLGASDAYQIGDVVMHNEKKWESEYKDNVWEPGVFGWIEKQQ